MFIFNVYTRTLIYPPHPQSGIATIDCIVENEIYGEGALRFELVPQIDDVSKVTPATVYIGRGIVSYPAAVPFVCTFVCSLDRFVLFVCSLAKFNCVCRQNAFFSRRFLVKKKKEKKKKRKKEKKNQVLFHLLPGRQLQVRMCFWMLFVLFNR